MKKKLCLCLLAASMLFLRPSVSDATVPDAKAKTKTTTVEAREKAEPKERTESKKVEISKAEAAKYNITKPEKKAFSIEKKISFVNGIAPAGTTVSIKVYGTADLTAKKFNLATLPKHEEYIQLATHELVVGKLGVFDKQLDLVTGINRVVVDFNVEGLDPVELIIFVHPMDAKAEQQLVKPMGLTNLIPAAEK